ncbi:alcohol dehydrogenase catalytic domain-containing protein [Asaia sp. VD9]|uniref:zinc-dependent alcohol dehydrogenase n=1 Tax=Asaia sp. VD9 TaxID=3081235 RepID=UPI00301A5950
MLAARLYGAGDIRIAPIPRLSPLSEGHVRIRVAYAGICGSDLHNYRTGRWLTATPRIPGHKFCGIITEISSNCGELHCGEAVIADSRLGCGACTRCRAGQANLCPDLAFVGEGSEGGFAQEVVLPATQLLPYPIALPLRYGALVEPLSVALHALNRLNPMPAQPVLVCGGGTIGGLCALLLRRRGHVVWLLERHAGRSRMLETSLGTRSLPPEPELWTACLRGSAGGTDETQASQAELALAIDTTGSHGVIEMLGDQLVPGGRLVLAGIFDSASPLDLNRIVERELTLLGVSAYAHEMTEALALLSELAPHLDYFLSPAFPLEALPMLYARLTDAKGAPLEDTAPDNAPKILIAPNGKDSDLRAAPWEAHP